MKTCNIQECNNKHSAKGLCSKHYQQTYRDLYNTQYRKVHKIEKAEYQKQWRENNKEHKARVDKQWRQDNKECLSKQKSQYYFQNIDEITKTFKQYYLNNKKRILKQVKQYQQDNKEKRKQWYQTPSGKAIMKAHCHNRRALTKDLTKKTIQRVYEHNILKYGTLTCYLCDKPIKFGEDSLEHSTPISRGGTNDYDNLGIAHLKCNMRKHTMTLEEWYEKTNIGRRY